MVQQRFSVSAIIRGGLDRQFISSIRRGAGDVDRLSRGVKGVQGTLDGLREPLRRTDRQVRDVAGSANRATGAFNRMAAAMRRAGGAGRALGGLRTAAIGAGSAFLGTQFLNQGVAQNRQLVQAQRDALGVTQVEARQILRVAQLRGFEESDFGDIIYEFNRELGSYLAGEGEGRFETALAAAGLNAAQISRLSGTEQAVALLDAIEGIENRANRARVADALAGEQGGKIIGLLTQNTEDYAAVRRELTAIPLFTDEQINQARRGAEQFNRVGFAVKDLSSIALRTLEPTLDVVGDTLDALNRKLNELADNAPVAAQAAGLAVLLGPTAASIGGGLTSFLADAALIGTFGRNIPGRGRLGRIGGGLRNLGGRLGLGGLVSNLRLVSSTTRLTSLRFNLLRTSLTGVPFLFQAVGYHGITALAGIGTAAGTAAAAVGGFLAAAAPLLGIAALVASVALAFDQLAARAGGALAAVQNVGNAFGVAGGTAGAAVLAPLSLAQFASQRITGDRSQLYSQRALGFAQERYAAFNYSELPERTPLGAPVVGGRLQPGDAFYNYGRGGGDVASGNNINITVNTTGDVDAESIQRITTDALIAPTLSFAPAPSGG